MWVKHTSSQTIFNTRNLHGNGHNNVFLISRCSAVYSVVIPCAAGVYLRVIMHRFIYSASVQQSTSNLRRHSNSPLNIRCQSPPRLEAIRHNITRSSRCPCDGTSRGSGSTHDAGERSVICHLDAYPKKSQRFCLKPLILRNACPRRSSGRQTTVMSSGERK